MAKFKTLNFVGIIFCLFMLSSCLQRPLLPCQEMTWRGYTNISECVYRQSLGAKYNDLGVIGTDHKIDEGNPHQIRILLMGDSLISGEFLEPQERVTALLEEELRKQTGKEIVVINAGIRNSSALLFERKIASFKKFYRPQLSLFVYGGETHLATSYFAANKLIEMCPIVDLMLLNRNDPYELLFSSSLSLFRAMGPIPPNKIFWVGGPINTEALANQIPGCHFIKRLVKNQNITDSMLERFFTKAELPLIVVPSVPVLKLESWSNNSEIKMRVVENNHVLAKALTKWILPELH